MVDRLMRLETDLRRQGVRPLLGGTFFVWLPPDDIDTLRSELVGLAMPFVDEQTDLPEDAVMRFGRLTLFPYPTTNLVPLTTAYQYHLSPDGWLIASTY